MNINNESGTGCVSSVRGDLKQRDDLYRGVLQSCSRKNGSTGFFFIEEEDGRFWDSPDLSAEIE